MKIEDIQKDSGEFEDSEFIGKIDDACILQAKHELGLPFPPEYGEFLKVLGSGSVSSESFIGLGGAHHLDVVWLTKTLRHKAEGRRFPKTFLPVRADGYGNHDCIDTSQPTSNGECAIVEWLHDGSDETGNRVLAKSYFEWFVSILNMLREIEQGG